LENALVVIVSDIHGGMKDVNPVEKVWFYGKDDFTPFRLKSPYLIPAPPRQKIVRLFCREEDNELIRCAEECFTRWCNANGLAAPRSIMDNDGDEMEFASHPSSVLKHGESCAPIIDILESVKKNLQNDATFNK